LAALSQQAHHLASQPCEGSEPSQGLAAVEAQVDEAAAELWGITEKELQEIRRSLAAM
jgi:phage I-like protein